MQSLGTDPLRDRFRQLYILCGAILMSVVLVNVVLAWLLATGGLPPPSLPEPLPLVLFSAGMVALVAAPAVKGAILRRAGAGGLPGDPGGRFEAYRKANAVAFALRETGGLIGFVLAVSTGNPWWSWGLGGAALIAMIVDWPKPEHLGS